MGWTKTGCRRRENSICVIPVCDYVGGMSWPDILTLVIVLGIATVFLWRSSGKEHKPGCGCGCDHGHEPEPKKKITAP